jgi:hypothetical protein
VVRQGLERLAFANCGDGRSYELWRTPELKAPFHLFAIQDGVEISKMPVQSETRGRIEFERKVANFVEGK